MESSSSGADCGIWSSRDAQDAYPGSVPRQVPPGSRIPSTSVPTAARISIQSVRSLRVEHTDRLLRIGAGIVTFFRERACADMGASYPRTINARRAHPRSQRQRSPTMTPRGRCQRGLPAMFRHRRDTLRNGAKTSGGAGRSPHSCAKSCGDYNRKAQLVHQTGPPLGVRGDFAGPRPALEEAVAAGYRAADIDLANGGSKPSLVGAPERRSSGSLLRVRCSVPAPTKDAAMSRSAPFPSILPLAVMCAACHAALRRHSSTR